MMTPAPRAAELPAIHAEIQTGPASSGGGNNAVTKRSDWVNQTPGKRVYGFLRAFLTGRPEQPCMNADVSWTSSTADHAQLNRNLVKA